MKPMVALPSARLELRPLGGREAPFVESLYASPQVTRTLLRIQGPLSTQEAREFCQTPSVALGEHRLVATLRRNDEPIGVGSVRMHAAPHGVASIGYSVLPAFWGDGFGTELAALLVEFAFGTLGALEVRATTLDENRASARVLEKVGFAVREAGACEVDSRGNERRVTRWCLRRPV